jgi:predicted dinucleotide-binding enzyme
VKILFNVVRRTLLAAGCGALAAIYLHALPVVAAEPAAKPMKIGIIGSGRVGGTIGSLWVKAGHEVLFSSRHPEQLKEMAEKLGPRARVGTPRDAVLFGDVVFIAVPYSAMPQVGQDLSAELAGKVVLDASNPVPGRDGDMAVPARAKGAGLATAEYLPKARLVRAFNSYGAATFASEAHRAGERLAIPLGGDDKDALTVAARLVADAGFDPVIVGSLSRSKEFDLGTPGAGAQTARQLRERFGLAQTGKP